MHSVMANSAAAASVHHGQLVQLRLGAQVNKALVTCAPCLSLQYLPVQVHQCVSISSVQRAVDPSLFYMMQSLSLWAQ
jgi:hypothetical protein